MDLAKEIKKCSASLAELGRKSGIDASTIGQIKRGKFKGSTNTRCKIIAAIKHFNASDDSFRLLTEAELAGSDEVVGICEELREELSKVEKV